MRAPTVPRSRSIGLNMTPMIDIVFQMVMFFIIITDFSQQDIAMLEDLFRAAVNQATEKAKALQQESLSQVTGGMKLPNLPFL